MQRAKRLSIFALLVVSALATLFFGIQVVLRHYADRAMAQGEIVEKERLAIAINLFHSHFHNWPSAPGPVGIDAFTELIGGETAKINTEHINFFQKADAELDVLDRHGRVLFFKTDDTRGTCTVYSETEP